MYNQVLNYPKNYLYYLIKCVNVILFRNNGNSNVCIAVNIRYIII